jgi:hypothetical protein
MIDRVGGVITLKSAIFREIADDTTATKQSFIIVVVATLIAGFFSGLVQIAPDTTTASVNVLGGVALAAIYPVFQSIMWAVNSWALAFVSKRFGSKTNVARVLRVTGYLCIYDAITILSALALVSPALLCVSTFLSLIVSILRLVGSVICVREAAELSTGKAIGTLILAGIVSWIVLLALAIPFIGVVSVLAAYVAPGMGNFFEWLIRHFIPGL